VLVLATSAAATPASAASTKKKFDINEIGYNEIMRTGAIEPWAEIPRNVPTDLGYSKVSLIKDIEEASPRCIADGGGYWLDDILEEGVLKGGAAPIGDGQTAADASPYDNPTVHRVYRPANADDGSDTASSDRTPKIPSDGNGPLWTSSCTPDFFGGSGTGDYVSASGARIAGSSVTSQIDKATGTYTATGRAYVTTLAGAFDTVTSVVQIVHAPNQEPKISYRLSLFDSDAGKSAFASDGVEFVGSAVPASQLVEQFNTQAAAFAQQAGPVGPAGLQILAPQVYPDQDTGRLTITAPAVAGNVGLTARAGTAGQDSGARLAAVTWTGDNVSADAL
jgi:hypothetical protein